MIGMVVLAVVVSGLTARGILEAVRGDFLEPVTSDSRSQMLNLGGPDAMARPGPTKGVNLKDPKPATTRGKRSYAPLKPKESCSGDKKVLTVLEVQPGSQVCGPSATRQSPKLLDAPAFKMAKGDQPTQIPEHSPADNASPTPSETAAPEPTGSPTSEPTADTEGAGGGEGTDGEDDGEPEQPASPSPAAEPEAGDLVIKPASFSPHTLADPTGTSDTYLSPNWGQLSPATSPTATMDSKMAYDPLRGQYVLFGGRIGTTQVYNDTWVWAAGNWVKLNPTTKPSARYAHGMTWDESLDKIVVFGGRTSAGANLNDVWAWDGTNWAALAPTGTKPAVRASMGFAYDHGRAGIVLFGGNGATNYNDTWQLKNNAWTQIQANGAAGAPSVREAMAMEYSYANSKTIMFGGGTGACPSCTLSNQTWTLGAAATSWSQVATPAAQTPSARRGAAITYDPGVGAVVMFGGLGVSSGNSVVHNDTWAWNGAGWSKALGIASPTGRSGAAMASDPSGRVLLWGGSSTTGPVAETWSYDATLPVIDIRVTDTNDNEQPVYWTGESIKINLAIASPGQVPITLGDGVSIVSALDERVLAAGAEIVWNGFKLPLCTGSDVCGGISDLTTTITNLTLGAGGVQVGDFVASLAGTQRGCELIDIPATIASLTGADINTYDEIMVCGGGLGLEKWWTYDTTDLGNGGTASVNATNGNLVVQHSDSAPVQTPGRLALGLGRVYNSQDLMTNGGPIGAGWNFDLGGTGETAGGFGIGGLKLPNVQTLTQPLSMPYVDRDGTRHVFKLRSISANAKLGLPVDLTAGGSSNVLSNLLGGATKTLKSLLSGSLTNLCVDQAYTGPKGSNMFLFRYIGVGSDNACANPAGNGGATVGWSLVRPDRVRYDFNALGDLVSITDPTGQQLKFENDLSYGPKKITTECGDGPACPVVEINYTAPGSTTTYRHVRVTDAADRVTTYIITREVVPQLIEVWLPGNPVPNPYPGRFSWPANPADAVGPTPSIAYSYARDDQPCGNVPGRYQDEQTSEWVNVTVGQLCTVTDAHGQTTQFTYTQAPLGPDRIATVTDRRGNDAQNDGANKGLRTKYTWHDNADQAPDWVTADMATPNTVGGCSATCQRVRYSQIDAHGRVGVLEEGSVTSSGSNSFLRQTGYMWDTESSACSLPSGAMNHNLCQTIRRAVPSDAPFVRDGVTATTVGDVVKHDQATDYLYGDLGQPLRKRVLTSATADANGNRFTDAKAAVTTYGTVDQYFDADGARRMYANRVAGNGDVIASGSGSDYVPTVKKDAPVHYWRLEEAPGAQILQAEVGQDAAVGYGTLGQAGAMTGSSGLLEPGGSAHGAAIPPNVGLSNFAQGTTAGGSDFAIETWQKTTSTSNEAAVQWGTATAYGSVGRDANGLPGIRLVSDSSAGSAHAQATNSISDGQWHHVVYTYNGNGSTDGMAIWVDGVKQTLNVVSDSLAGQFAGPSPAVNFFQAGAGPTTDSTIDEVALYNRVLAPDRIKAHYRAATDGGRLQSDTLYAVTDQVQELSPRGNAAASAWGDFLTTTRRDITNSGTTSTNAVADPSGAVCDGAVKGNTGLVCDVIAPAPDGVPNGQCDSQATNPGPAGIPAAPTGAGFRYACTTYAYNSFGQRTKMRTAKANAEGGAGYNYGYYAVKPDCVDGNRKECDLSGSVNAGGWLKAVTDPAGERTIFAYDAAGNVARTWERNATHGHDLSEPWANPGATPSTAFTEQVNANPVTPEALSVSSTALITVAPDGTVRGAGSNSLGELGDGTTTARATAVQAKLMTNVVAVSQSTSSTGTCFNTLFLTGDGDVYRVGGGVSTPTKVVGLADVISIHAGGCHMLALDAKGRLFAWGSNASGQLGDGTTTSTTNPGLTPVLENVSTMTAGYQHSLAVKTDGTLWAWGANGSGQLGLGDTTQRTAPAKVSTLTGVRSLSAAVNNSFAVDRAGKVWAWGAGTNGGLGLGDLVTKNVPTKSTALGAGTPAGAVRNIVAATNGGAALLADGTVRAWGLNNASQLGAATPAQSSSPVVVPGVTGQVALVGGSSTYATADAAGKITVWGSTANHQRADGAESAPAESTPATAGIDVSPFRLPSPFLRAKRDATGNLVTQTTDRLGNVRRVRSGRGNELATAAFDKTVGYDAAARPIWTGGAQHRAAGSLTSTTYDPFGNPIKTVDARGNATRATFDAVNRQLTSQFTRPGAELDDPSICTGTATTAEWTADQNGQRICVASTTYDGADRTLTVTDADNQVTKHSFDAASRKIGTDTPRNDGVVDWVKSRWVYDVDGNVIRFCPPRQIAEGGACVDQGVYATHFQIDRVGNTAKQTRYRGVATNSLVTSYAFDADGNTISLTDANGHQTTQSFDLMGRRLEQTVPRTPTKSNTTRWSYDYTGNVTSITSPGSLNTGSGANGDLVVDGTTAANSTDNAAHGATNPFQIHEGARYRSVTLQNGAHVTSGHANGLVFSVTGSLTVCATCVITMDGKGYTGGASKTDAANPLPGNGGLKGNGTALAPGSGGGGGGHKTAGTAGITNNSNAPGAGGAISGTSTFNGVGANYLLGSGGGGGGGGAGGLGKGGVGGNGGGYIRITAGTIVVNGVVTANGVAGGPSTANSGGGGGGAGGGIWLAANDIQLAADDVLHVQGAGGGAGTNGANGGAGGVGRIRLDGDTITNKPAAANNSNAAMVTAISWDAANRPIDTVEGAQTDQANPWIDQSNAGTPDNAGLENTRTRSFYNADGMVAATLPPTAFTDQASLTAPNVDVARRVDYDLDGRQAAVYVPRYNSAVASIGAGNDGNVSGSNQQVDQCKTSRVVDAVAGLADYGSTTGVCVTRTIYDAAGNTDQVWLPSSNGSDERYLKYSYTGDNLPRVTNGPDPDGTGRVDVATTHYDGTGNVTAIVDAFGNIDQTQYTGDDLIKKAGQAWKPTPTSSTISEFTETTYDANGNVKTVKTPKGELTTNTWTSDDLLQQITAPPADGSTPAANAITKYGYDKVGNPVTVHDPRMSANSWAPMVYEYTRDNLIKRSHTPITASSYRSVEYTYSPAGLKTSTETAKCASAVTSNCVPGNPAWTSAGHQRLTYGPNGRLSDQRGRDKSSITTLWTQDGQPKEISDPTSGITVTAGYYLDGRLRTVDDGENANTYAYDGSGQVTVRTDQTAAAGVTAGSKIATSYAYNQAALPASMTSGVLGQTTTYSYDTAGRIDTAVTGTHNVDWAWQPTGRVAEVRNAVGTTDVTHTYGYDLNGNVTSHTASGDVSYNDSYTYEPGQQVATWSHGGSTTTYKYDPSNNRQSVTASGSTTTWSYNRDNSINNVAGPTGTKQFTYNNGGLMTSDGCSTTSYDDFDRVNKVVNTSGTGCGTDLRTTTYTYDGLDRQRRVSVAAGSGTPAGEVGTVFSVFDGLSANLVGQKDANAGDTTKPEMLYQLDASGQAVAYEQTQLGTGHKAFLDTDGQGNVSEVLETNGNLACEAQYEPYGGAAGTTTGGSMCVAGTRAASSGNAIWYRGQPRDASTGSYQLGARTYNPLNGAFTTPDVYRVAAPATDLSVGTDPQTMNTYSYVNGNPVNLWDPTGHDPCGGDYARRCYQDPETGYMLVDNRGGKPTKYVDPAVGKRVEKKERRLRERRESDTDSAHGDTDSAVDRDFWITQLQTVTDGWADELLKRVDWINESQGLSKVDKLVRARFWREASDWVRGSGHVAGWLSTALTLDEAWGDDDGGRGRRIVVATTETMAQGATALAAAKWSDRYCKFILCRGVAAGVGWFVAGEVSTTVIEYSDGSTEAYDSDGNRLMHLAPEREYGLEPVPSQ